MMGWKQMCCLSVNNSVAPVARTSKHGGPDQKLINHLTPQRQVASITNTSINCVAPTDAPLPGSSFSSVTSRKNANRMQVFQVIEK